MSRRGSLVTARRGSLQKRSPPSSAPPIQVIVTGDEEEQKKDDLTTKDYDKLKQTTRFTEFEIVQLWNSFKTEFPNGKINRSQLGQLIVKVFPKNTNSELILRNIFRIFDPEETGYVRFNELLMAFSMTMRGSVEEKLKWAFKLYDVDGSGEIDEDEMCEIFEKLCKITAGPSTESIKKKKELEKKEKEEKLKEAQRKKKEKLEKEKQIKKNNRLSVDLGDIGLMSNKHKNPVEAKKRTKAAVNAVVKAKKEEQPEKLTKMEDVVEKVLEDPERDCSKFDIKKRAKDLFDALDDDGSGGITEDEFVDGCMMDEVFVKLLQDFNGDHIWGYQKKSKKK